MGTRRVPTTSYQRTRKGTTRKGTTHRGTTRRGTTHKGTTRKGTTRKGTTRRGTTCKGPSGGGTPYDPLQYRTFTVERYFENLVLPASVQVHLMALMNLQIDTLSAKVQKALGFGPSAIRACNPNDVKDDALWEKCSGECKTLIVAASEQEAHSTAFMLKVLADSIIRPDGRQHRLQIMVDDSFFGPSGCRTLTGLWKDDARYFHLVLPPTSRSGSSSSGSSSSSRSKGSRLIMGFGPSSSGKTHLAKTILAMLKEADPSFPEVFFSLDGGIIRESSAAYQFAKEIARCKGWGGFTNLLGGIFRGDMFPSDDVKKIMEAYLLQESSRVPISLYVPETLGVCDWIYPVKKSCLAIVDGYQKITQDESWIGLLIWQHKYKADHAKDLAFVKGEECMGCTESGMDREKKEGKKYSNAAYEGSMKKGRRYLEMAPGGRYEIHNAGRRGGISVLWDTSPPGVGEGFSTIMRGRRDFRYVRGPQASPVPPLPMDNATSPQGVNANAKAAANAKTTANAKATANEKAKAKNATRKNAAMKARSDPRFVKKVAAAKATEAQRAINEAQRKRNEAEGTPEAAAKRLAALRMPSAKEQEAAKAAAKEMGVARRAANAKRAVNEAAAAKQAVANAAVLRNAEAAAAAYQNPERSASRAEKARMNRYSYSGNVGPLTNDSMVGSVTDL